jgi:hypothetical protein
MIDFGIRVPDHLSQGDLLVDAFQVEQKPYATTYCDGDLGDGYTWVGGSHASTSTRMETRVLCPATAVDFSAGAIAIWLRPGQFYNGTYIFESYPARLDAYLDTGGDIFFRVFDDGNRNGAQASLKLRAEEADNWQKLVFVWSQIPIDGQNMWIFGDGRLQSQTAASYWPATLATDYVQIQPGIGRAVSEFMVFARALTASEIAALYRTSLFVSE